MIDEHEHGLIKALILHPAGYDLDLLGILSLRVTSDRTIEMHVEYAVGELLPEDAHHVEKNRQGQGHIVTYSWNISQVDEAVEFFLRTRQERDIGIDIEDKFWSKVKSKTT